MALLNVLQIVALIRTCYNWYYNSNSLPRQHPGLKSSFSRRGAQIISLEIIQTDYKKLFENRGRVFWGKSWTFSRKYVKLFKEYILRLRMAHWGPRTLGRTLSLRNLKRNLSPKILSKYHQFLPISGRLDDWTLCSFSLIVFPYKTNGKN